MVILVAARRWASSGARRAWLADVVGLARYGPDTPGHDPEDAALALAGGADHHGPACRAAAAAGGRRAGGAGRRPSDDTGTVGALRRPLPRPGSPPWSSTSSSSGCRNLFTYPDGDRRPGRRGPARRPAVRRRHPRRRSSTPGFLLVARVGYQLLRGREGMAWGDIKLALSLGATAGWLGGPYTDPSTVGSLQLVIYAAWPATCSGAVAAWWRCGGVDRELPFGPALVLGWPARRGPGRPVAGLKQALS